MFAMLPPLTNRPPHDAGKPMNSATHRTACRSISVAAGDSDQAPTFGLIAAASMSPRMPIGAADAVM